MNDDPAARRYTGPGGAPVELPRGDVTDGVVRVGTTVRRPHQPQSLAVAGYLDHLQRRGFDGAPRYLGRDGDGRDVLSFLPGAVAGDPPEEWAADVALLRSVGALLLRLHQASAGYLAGAGLAAPAGSPWVLDQMRAIDGAAAPEEWDLVSHNDVTPQNVVVTGGVATGLIDFDLAGPASRIGDVYNTAMHWVPLRAPQDVVASLAGSARVRAGGAAAGVLRRVRPRRGGPDRVAPAGDRPGRGILAPDACRRRELGRRLGPDVEQRSRRHHPAPARLAGAVPGRLARGAGMNAGGGGPPAAVVARLRAAGCVFAEDEARLLVDAARTPGDLVAMVDRRVSGVPLEHVLGWVLFCGRRIAVDPGVFVPRRRTEFLVAEAVARARPGSLVVDLCCGSGAVGVAVAAALGGVELHAVDLDPVAVRCARRNVEPLGGRVHQGDLVAPLPAELAGRVDVLVANVPYVPTDALAMMPPEARDHEPRVALDGGADGLDVARRMVALAPRWLAAGGCMLIETSERQAPALVEAMARVGLEPAVSGSEELGGTVVAAIRPLSWRA